MVKFGGVNYTDKTRLLMDDVDEYLKNPTRQKIKSWVRLAKVFLGAKGLKNKGKKIVFLPFTKTQANLFFNVSKNFQDTSFFIFDNLVLEITKNLKQLGVQAHPYFHFVRKKDVMSVFHEWVGTKKGKSKEDLFYFRIRKRIMFLDLFRLALSNYLQASKTKVIILPEDRSDLALVAIEVARELKIKSVNFQHGFYSDEKIKRMYKNHKDSADIHLVYGAHFKKEYEKNGVPSKKIKIIGAPQYEALKRTPTKIPTIIYASQRLPEREAALKTLKALKIENIKIIDKLHPVEVLTEQNIHYKILNDSEVEIIKDGSVEDMLEKCDVFLTITSTAFLGAAALGIPVGFFREPEIDFEKYRIGVKITSDKSLERFVEGVINRRISFTRGQKKFVTDYLGPYKNSNNLIIKKINELIKTRS